MASRKIDRRQRDADERFMRLALSLARRGIGNTAPNPAVGCVIVRDGLIVGRGFTQPGGRPHAETEALRQAGAMARGATAYVTLEPCCHHGHTPPCTDALIGAGISRCVIALEDPDGRVSGEGEAALRDAGIETDVGLLEQEAARLNDGFLLAKTQDRPLFTLKMATSLDGRIATHAYESKWITGEEARARAHLLRSQHDAIIVGSVTAMRDAPSLTCRLPGLEHRSPVRVVFDSHLHLPLTHPLVRTAAEVPTWIICRDGLEADRHKAFLDCGVEVIEVAVDMDGRPDVRQGARALAEKGITRALIEGGGGIAASFVAADLVDRIAWFRSGTLIGGDGIAAIGALGLPSLADCPAFVRLGTEILGDDLLESFARAL